ncbi:MAG: AAA family ATPase [Phycisphaerales bacterium]|jgi:predicted ATPase
MPTKKPKLAVSSLRVRNFKAIVDSKTVRFTPLTVFIGNNGSGKSSLMESLELVQRMAHEDVDVALDPFLGLEHVRHKAAVAAATKQGKTKQRDPATGHLQFVLSGWAEPRNGGLFGRRLQRESYDASISIGTEQGGERVVVAAEVLHLRGDLYAKSVRRPRADALRDAIGRSVETWQFLDMSPREMGRLRSRRRTSVRMALQRDGSNLAEYLLDMRDGSGRGISAQRAEEGLAAFNGFVEAMRQVLPYASDLRPVERDVLERKVFLELMEPYGKDGLAMQIPGWLMSTGTLRIAALLAVLRHPEPPPLICIEEIENGLDPRTIQLLVSEIQYAVERRGIQVMVTTHSPYFLDLVPLDTVVFVERGEKGPSFTRPADDAELRGWAEKFSPGQLYTMNTMTGSGSRPRKRKP